MERQVNFLMEEYASMRKEAMDAFNDLRRTAIENGVSGMPLEEINAEIKASREERRNRVKNGTLKSILKDAGIK